MDTDKTRILKRLARVEGQVRGISRMVAEDKPAIDTITQIRAALAALELTALNLLTTQLHARLTDDAANHDPDETVKQLQAAVQRLLMR